MDSEKLNRWLTLGANLGVVVGIIFLAIEVRQNNENRATEIRATNFFGMAETWSMVAENRDLADAISKDMRQVELSDAEGNQLLSYWVRVFLTLQWGYQELPDAEFRRGIEFQRLAFLNSSTHSSSWAFAEPLLDPEFVKFMNDNIFVEE